MACLDRRHAMAAMVLVGALVGCDEDATIGDRADAGALGDAGMTGAPDAFVAPGDDAAIPTPDAGPIGPTLGHLEVQIVTTAANVVPGMPSTAMLEVHAWEAAPDFGTPVAPTEVFGPCRVGGGVIPGPDPISVDLGETAVEAEIGASGPMTLVRSASGGDITYHTERFSPAPPAGTPVHVRVTTGGHTYEIDTVTAALDFTAPAVTEGIGTNVVTYAPGSDLVVSWPSTGLPHVLFTNLRYSPSGGGASTQVACDGDASTTMFTIPARIVAESMQNAPGASTDSVLVLQSWETTDRMDGAVSISVTTVARSREASWPHG